MASALNVHNPIREWSLSSSQLPNSQCEAYNQQKYKHQCCSCVDCILQIFLSSYRISLSFNQSFVINIRSISISSPSRFYFVLYRFIDFSWSPLPLRSAQSRGPPDLLWSSLRYGRCKADIHRMSRTLVFALIRVRRH